MEMTPETSSTTLIFSIRIHFLPKGICYIYRNDPRNFLYNFDFFPYEDIFAPPPRGGC